MTTALFWRPRQWPRSAVDLKTKSSDGRLWRSCARVLSWGLRSSGDDLLSDVSPRCVSALKAVVDNRLRKKVSLQPGDVVAIAAEGGRLLSACVHYEFNVRFGIWALNNVFQVARVPSQSRVVRHPFYSDLEGFREGTWTRVGNSKRLLKLFPATPVIYHKPASDDPETGKYGCWEAPDGTCRRISKKEATELGLLSGTYRQHISSPLVNRYLTDWIG